MEGTRFNLFGNDLGVKIAKRFANLGMLVKGSALPHTTQELVALRASQINGCGWCIDMHTKDALAAGESATRLHLVAAWRESSVFTEAEQAALAFTEEATRLGDANRGVTDETWDLVRKHYDDEQLTALIVAVGFINAANRLAVTTGQKGGSYEPGAMAAMLD